MSSTNCADDFISFSKESSQSAAANTSSEAPTPAAAKAQTAVPLFYRVNYRQDDTPFAPQSFSSPISNQNRNNSFPFDNNGRRQNRGNFYQNRSQGAGNFRGRKGGMKSFSQFDGDANQKNAENTEGHNKFNKSHNDKNYDIAQYVHPSMTEDPWQHFDLSNVSKDSKSHNESSTSFESSREEIDLDADSTGINDEDDER